MINDKLRVELAIADNVVHIRILSMPEAWRGGGTIVEQAGDDSIYICSLDHPAADAGSVFLWGTSRTQDKPPFSLQLPDAAAAQAYYNRIIAAVKHANAIYHSQERPLVPYSPFVPPPPVHILE